MALTVGELNIELEVRTAAFRAQLLAAERRIGRFERTAQRGTVAAIGGFRNLAVTVGLVTAALATLGTALTAVGLFRFISEGVRAAATFESIGVALQTLTGSAEGAATVLDEVNKLVVETPFALDEVASAARSVAVVFRGNTDAVAEFTAITADLAAATTKPIQQIGENLVRAFSSGLGAAEVFRDSGITEFIKEAAGETDITKISSEELAIALRKLTSEGGVFFRAAADQAATLGGAISNTAIAFDNFRRAVGASISEPLVDFMVNRLQPAFQALEKIVMENADSLADFASRVLGFLTTQFGNVFQGVIDLLSAIGPLADAFDFLRAISSPLLNFNQAFARSLLLIVGTIADLVRAAVSGATAISAAAKFDFAGAKAAAAEFTGNLASIEERFDKTVEAIKGDVTDVIEAFTGIGDTRDALDSAVAGLENLRDTTREVIDEIANAPARMPIRAANIVPPAAADGGEEDPGDAGETFGARFAEGFGSAFNRAVRGESVDFIGEFATLLGDASEESLKDAFDESISVFGSLLKGVVDKAGIGQLFEGGGAFGGVGTFFKEKLGEEGGQALGGAALGILGAGISAFRAREQGRAQAAGGISAVTSVQQVRGIVAGPTSIAVAQVDRAIADAFVEPTRLLTIIAETNTKIAQQGSSTQTGSIPTGGSDAATIALANEGASLV